MQRAIHLFSSLLGKLQNVFFCAIIKILQFFICYNIEMCINNLVQNNKLDGQMKGKLLLSNHSILSKLIFLLRNDLLFACPYSMCRNIKEKQCLNIADHISGLLLAFTKECFKKRMKMLHGKQHRIYFYSIFSTNELYIINQEMCTFLS